MPLYALFDFTLGNRREMYEASLEGFVLELLDQKITFFAAVRANFIMQLIVLDRFLLCAFSGI